MSNANVLTFEYKDDKSSKFWEISQKDLVVTVRYGKTGTTGQSQSKEFAEASAAQAHVEKLIKEKNGKGYVELGVVTAKTQAESASSSDPIQATTTQSKAAASKAMVKKNLTPPQDPQASPESLLTWLGKDDSTNRLLAKHPRVSAELLEKLSHSSDESTRRGVAANPNTPPEIFIKLGQQFPKEFLANPALDLLLMVQPALMEEVPQALLIRLLKQADCPASMLTWAASHKEAKVQLAVAMNAKAPEQAKAMLRVSRHAAVQEAMKATGGGIDQDQDPEKAFEKAVRDKLASMMWSELNEAWSEGDIGLPQWSALPLAFRLAKATNSDGFSPTAIVRLMSGTSWTLDGIRSALPGYNYWDEVASDPKIPASVLEVLAQDTNDSVRYVVGRNPSTPATILEILAKDRDSDVRSSVAANPSTPGVILAVLAKEKDRDSELHTNVAENPSTPLATLMELARDKSEGVRRRVAKNPSTPMAALEVLSQDKDSDVLHCVAENPSTPLAVRETVLTVLAKSKSEWKRKSVATHQLTPVPVLEDLSKDKDRDVRCSVAENPNTTTALLEILAQDKDSKVRRSVAQNPSTPVSVLHVLANDEDDDVLWRVARNPASPLVVLEALAQHKFADVRRNVAENPNTPTALLEVLARDKNGEVRYSVAKNPSSPISARQMVWEQMANDPDRWIRHTVAENTSTPVSILEVLAQDKDSEVRSGIAGNSQTPSDILGVLANDKTAGVLLGVVGNPNTPLSALLPLTASKSVSVREALTKHAHRSAEICQALWRDLSEDVRLAVLRYSALDQATLDELALDIKREIDAVTLLGHPNLSPQTAQRIADKLLTTPAIDSPWYQYELSKATPEVAAAAKAQAVLSYFGKDPNKAVLAKRPLAPVMALCAGPFVEPSRIVKVTGSTDWLVRAAVARNPGTPPNLLKKLTTDAHPLVALLAQVKKKHQVPLNDQDLAKSEAGIDLDRTIKEVAGRIPCADLAKMSPFFTDDVWVDHISTGQIAWMTACFTKQQLSKISLLEFPSLQRMLDPHQAALMFELAVGFERASKPLGSRARLVAAEDPLCPVNVLRDLANDDDLDVVLTLLRNSTFPEEERERIHRGLLQIRGKRLLELLDKKTVPTDILVAKSSSKDHFIRRTVAKNPSTPVAILELLAKDEESCVRKRVAENPSTPVAVLEVLAKDKDSGVRVSVPGNPSTPVVILEALAKDEDSFVRCGVAQNPSTPVAVLELLAKVEKTGVAEHPSTPVVILEALAKDVDSFVRCGVAKNPSTPVAVLELLAKDHESWVRNCVAKNPSTPAAVLELLAKNEKRWVRNIVAENPSTSVHTLGKLAQDIDAGIRASVAGHPSLAVTALEKLATDDEVAVRAAVALNPKTPIKVLQSLSVDPFLGVRWCVAGHAAQQPDFRDRFVNWWFDRLQRALDRESRVRAGEVPEAVNRIQPVDILRALHRLGLVPPTDDNKALTQASRSKDWLTRLGVALHPGASEGILKILRKDADPDVARAATSRCS